jgi:hypothetical protein
MARAMAVPPSVRARRPSPPATGCTSAPCTRQAKPRRRAPRAARGARGRGAGTGGRARGSERRASGARPRASSASSAPSAAARAGAAAARRWRSRPMARGTSSPRWWLSTLPLAPPRRVGARLRGAAGADGPGSRGAPGGAQGPEGDVGEGDGAALGVVGVKERGRGARAQHRCQLPREVVRVLRPARRAAVGAPAGRRARRGLGQDPEACVERGEGSGFRA